MLTDAQAPADGALSIDQAISQLTQEPVEAVTEEQAAPAQDTEGETSAPEVTEDGDETPTEETEAEAEETEAVEPLDPPKYWSQDAKAKFAELPPELQAVVLAQEGPREEAAAKAKAEAAEVRKAAEAEVQAIRQLGETLTQVLPQALERFKSKWDGVDWKATLEAYGAEETLKLKEDMAADIAALQALEANQQRAMQIAAENARKADAERLRQLAPHLVEDEAKRNEVIDYVVKTYGVDREVAKSSATAFEFAIAEKAMKWDRAQAALASKPKTQPAPIKAPVKPGAKSVSPTQSTAQQVKNRFSQTRSVDDAVALLLSKGQ